MGRKIKILRQLVLVVLVLAALVLCTRNGRHLAAFGCATLWDYLSGRSVAQGKMIVDAIYQYRDAHGVWPQYTTDLVRDDPALPERVGIRHYGVGSQDLFGSFISHFGAWYYIWRTGHGFELLRGRYVNYRSYAVISGRTTAVGLAARDAPPIAMDQLMVPRVLAELTARIQREPKALIHHQGKISLLVKLGRLNEALQAVDECATLLQDHWWPALTKAEIESQLGHTEEAVTHLGAWAQTAGSFQAYYAHYWFLKERGLTDEALSALVEAIKSPIRNRPDDILDDNPEVDNHPERVLDFDAPELALDAAKYAYLKGRYELALEALKLAWPQSHDLQAACKLALGRSDEALKDAALIPEGQSEENRQQVRSLRQAIKTGDSKYVYDVGSLLPAYSLFIEYE